MAALWIVVGEHVSGASADATINAQLDTLRSPIAGRVSMPARQLGSAIAAKDVLAVVSDPQVDAVHLDDLKLQREQDAASLARLKKEADSVAEQRSAMASRSTIYHQRRVAELTLRLKFAQWRLALLKGETAQGGSDAGAPSDEAAARTSIALNRAVEEVELLQNALTAALSGVYLGDGYNDAPFSEQHGIQLAEKESALRLDIEAATVQLAALDARIKAEVQRSDISGAAQIAAGVDGIFWQRLSHDGDNVQRGDPVLRVVDCGHQLVTASVSERTYQGLARGQVATFRPMGQGRTFKGVIVRLAGAGAATVYEGLAVAPRARHLQRYDVAIAVPGLRETPDLSCAIGRTGRVFFETQPLDWLRNLW